MMRRLFWFAMLSIAAVVLVRRRADRNVAPTIEAAGEDQWPALAVPPTAPTDETVALDRPTPTWVVPEDGGCPPTHPVKVNGASGIFHVPGGRFYERTVPSRCYRNIEDAAADGYRAAKA